MTENRQGTITDTPDDQRTSMQRRLLLLPFCLAVFSLSALLYYHLRQDFIAVQSPLQVAYSVIYRTFGFAPSLMFFLLLLIWTSIWFFSGKIERPWSRLLRLFATTVMLGVFLNVGESGVVIDSPQQGELGAFFARRVVAAFGYYPSLILVLIATLGALLLATDFLFSETFERLWAKSSAREASGLHEDLGVETEVTDHLKQLSSVAQPTGALEPRAAPLSSSGPVEEDLVEEDPVEEDPVEEDAPAALPPQGDGQRASSEPDDAIATEVHDFGEFDADARAEPEIEGPMAEAHPTAIEGRRHRRSSFERREETREIEAAAAADAPSAAQEESWLPPVPEAQEIDNPETAASGIEAAASEAEAQRARGPEDDAPEAEAQIEDVASEDVHEQVLEEEADEQPHEEQPYDEQADETEVEDSESVFSIPRPEPEPEPEPVEEVESSYDDSYVLDPVPNQQQKLFITGIDEDLIDEAKQVVLESRRVSAAFLRRRLRIGYEEACEVLAELSARGVVELDDDASQGRIREE